MIMVEISFKQIYLLVFVLWVIITVCAYIIDWNITRNGFMYLAVNFACITLGLVTGRNLTLKEKSI